MKRYYLEVSVDNSKDASSKAVKDCNQILKNLGFISFQLNILRSGNKFIKKIALFKKIIAVTCLFCKYSITIFIISFFKRYWHWCCQYRYIPK